MGKLIHHKMIAICLLTAVAVAFTVWTGIAHGDTAPEAAATLTVSSDGNGLVTISIDTTEPVAALAADLVFDSVDPGLVCSELDDMVNCNPANSAGTVRFNRVSADPLLNITDLIELTVDCRVVSAVMLENVELYTNNLDAVPFTVEGELCPAVPLTVAMSGQNTNATSFLKWLSVLLLVVMATIITAIMIKRKAILLVLSILLPIIGLLGIGAMLTVTPAAAHPDGHHQVTIKLGDTDCDGDVTIIDILLADQYVSGEKAGKYLSCPDDPRTTMFLPACDADTSYQGGENRTSICTTVDILEMAACDVGLSNTYCNTTRSYMIEVTEVEQSSSPNDNNEVTISGNVIVANESGYIYNYGYALSTEVWDLTIPVCWVNPTAANEQGRTWTRDAIARTWEANSDVQFTGWGTCPEDNDEETIRIVVEDDAEIGPHTIGLGRQIRRFDEGMALNFTFNNWSTDCQNSLQFCIETIAVHEFGHALGFAHEHNREDTPEACLAEHDQQGTFGDLPIGDWDADSVMNYCNPDWLGNGELSAGDIETIQRFYTQTGYYFHQRSYEIDGICHEFMGEVGDDGGFIDYAEIDNCNDAPGSGNVETYITWVVGDALSEGLWRGGVGYIRTTPIGENGGAPESNAGLWEQCCLRGENGIPDLPWGGQGAFVVGSRFYNRAFEANGSCFEWQGDIVNGSLSDYDEVPSDCAGVDLLPGSGNVTSYTAWAFGDRLYESAWRNGIGYLRNRPLIGGNEVNWDMSGDDSSDWQECCTIDSVGFNSFAQGAYILWYE